MNLDDVKKHFGLFVRAVPGHLVTRLGVGEQIGAKRTPEGGYVWDTETVHALTHSEAQKYAREYQRAVKDGALVLCEAKDFVAFLEADAAKAKKTEEKAAADAAKASADAEKNARKES